MDDLVAELAFGLSGSDGSVERLDVRHIAGEQPGVSPVVGRGRPIRDLQIWNVNNAEISNGSLSLSGAPISHIEMQCGIRAGKLEGTHL